MRSTKLLSWTSRLLGFEPLPSPPHVFVLEPQRLLYGKLLRDGSGGWALQELRRLDLPPDTFHPGVVGAPLRDPNAFAATLGTFVGSFSAPPNEASLVLPDAWLRIAFTEVEELPRSDGARTEVLRWKLKRLVPFRVDQLRLVGLPVGQLPGQSNDRILLAFAVDQLLAELESAFASCGVTLGYVTNRALAAAEAVADELAGEALAALVTVAADGYTVLFTRRGEPLLYRYKGLDPQLEGAALATVVRRDLALTRAFLAEHLPTSALGRVLLLADGDEAASWRGWIAGGLGATPDEIGERLLDVSFDSSAPPLPVLTPMIGAAGRDIR